MPAVRLLQSLLAAMPPAMVAADSSDMVRLLESVANLLVRRSELECSYLARLEGELQRLLGTTQSCAYATDMSVQIWACGHHRQCRAVAGRWQGLWYYTPDTTCQKQLQLGGSGPRGSL